MFARCHIEVAKSNWFQAIAREMNRILDEDATQEKS
jgi:hypothetical protein